MAAGVTNLPDKPYFRVAEVSRLLAVPRRTVYYWIEIKLLKAHLPRSAKSKIKRSLIVISHEDLEQFLSESRPR